MATKYTFRLNGVDFSRMVERDSYNTALRPIIKHIETMDGIKHIALVRHRGTVTVGFNPQTADDSAALSMALLSVPVICEYHCIQRNQDVTAKMMLDEVAAKHLSRCRHRAQDWNDIGQIILEEL